MLAPVQPSCLPVLGDGRWGTNLAEDIFKECVFLSSFSFLNWLASIKITSWSIFICFWSLSKAAVSLGIIFFRFFSFFLVFVVVFWLRGVNKKPSLHQFWSFLFTVGSSERGFFIYSLLFLWHWYLEQAFYMWFLILICFNMNRCQKKNE